MKKEISPAMVAGVVALVVVVLGFAIWHSFTGPPVGDASKIPAGFPGGPHVRVAPGQLPPGASPPLGAPSQITGVQLGAQGR